ncbi:MAG: hypothetical protein ABL863_10560 [Nitrosomonas sp.]
MPLPKLLPRLLLIEDSDARINQFREWLPEGVVLVVAASAGRAIGTLQHSNIPMTTPEFYLTTIWNNRLLIHLKCFLMVQM